MSKIIESLTDVGHIGYIVDDLESNIAIYKQICGIDNFYVYDFVPMHAWAGKEEINNCKFKIGLGIMNNGLKIELIQPISGEKAPHFAFLSEKGSNIHHIAYNVNNYEEWREHFIKTEFAEIIFEAEVEDYEIGYRRSFYVRFEKAAGVVEISEIASKRKTIIDE